MQVQPRSAGSWRRASLGAVVVLVLLSGFLLGTAPQSSSADVGAPSWWNGDCDANNWNAAAAGMGWTGAGAHPLGASYLGVKVCGPRPGGDGAPNVLWSRSGWGHLEWQCPELAFRFMAQLYGVKAYGANGGEVVRNYTSAAGGGLVKVDNGVPGRPPLAGDVISFDNPGQAGHVGVVSASTVDASGNGSLTMMSQNDTADGWRTLSIVNWRVQGFGTYTPYGWLHDPLGRAGPATALPVNSGRFHPMAPVRVLDSRDGTGGASSPWVQGDTRNLTVAGVAGVPSNADAVMLNVTVTDTTAASYLTAWPAGQPRPTASNLNWPTGDTRPNLVVTKVGAGGAISLFNLLGTTNVIADVQGWFDTGSDNSGNTLVAVPPKRVLDSRDGTGGYSSPWTADTKRELTVAGKAGVPADADAVMLNVTVTDTTAPSYLTVWPAGQSRPTASNLNWPAGDTRPNLVVAKLGGDGGVSIYNFSGSAQVVVDVVGYFAGPTGPGKFSAVAPVRVLDSRDGTGGFSSPWGQVTSRTIAVAGVAGVPTDAKAVLVNITVTNATASSYLTAWPSGQQVPVASNLNFTAGATVPNLALVPIGTDGRIAIYNHNGSVDVVADVAGYTR